MTVGDTTVVASVAVGLSLLAGGLAGRWARRRGLLDPVEPRRSHTTPTPRMGGVGVLLGWAVGVWIGWRRTYAEGLDSIDRILPLLVGGGSFFVVGWLDDLRGGRRGLHPALKLGLQVAAALGAVAMGLRFEGWMPPERSLGGWPSLGAITSTPVLTTLWLVAVVNLLNFMDGIDGIVTTTAIVVLMSWVAAVPANDEIAPLAAAAALLGFGFWNAPPARLFLGDGGSHLVAFVVACGTCARPFTHFGDFQQSVPWPLVAAPLLPSVVDVAEALVHKARHGIPMSQAHNDHLYQRLVKAGWSHGAVAIRYGLLSLIGVVLAGPVAIRIGWVNACLIGAGVMAVHWWTGVRTTRGVPRLAKA